MTLARRTLLKNLAGALLTCVLCSATLAPAYAKDGGHEGGHDDGHDDDGGGRSSDRDQDDALWLLRKGRIIPLKTALKIADSKASGKVIDIKLTKGLGGAQYRIKVRRENGEIVTIRLDAQTGAFIGFLGF
jgi:uncharacterized membrane protein YkoI